MVQRQSERYEIEPPDPDAGSLALYAWAGIAALSALVACITVLMPVDTSILLANKPDAAVGEPSQPARRPDIVAPEEAPKSVVVATKESAKSLEEETAELLEKYGETKLESDPVTTATATREVEDASIEEIRPVQPFPEDGAMGATIGVSDSVPALAERYAALERRAPDLFQAIEPLVELVEGGTRLEARLVAGPFTGQAQLAEFCRAIKLRMTIECSAGDYSGEPLAQ